MAYKSPLFFRANGGFFRSSSAILAAGVASGGAVIATAIDRTSIDLRAALATLITAAAVALTDYVHRQRQLRAHQALMREEHRKTRRAVTRRRTRRKPRKVTSE